MHTRDKCNMSSIYAKVNRRFANISQFTVVMHSVEDNVISGNVNAIKEIFRTLDRSDDDVKNLASLLWVYKTILNATLIPLSDPMLRLKDRYQEILPLLTRHNIDPVLINTFRDCAERLWVNHKNNKFDRLLNIAIDVILETDSIGILGKIMYGDDPTCMNCAISSLAELEMVFTNIDSKGQLNGETFQKIFIVSPPMRGSINVMKSIFYTGVAPEVNCILYDHEHFHVPPRLELPISPNFKKSVHRFKISPVRATDPALNTVDGEESELDSWVEEGFWNDIHGGSRTKITRSIAAHYVLFDGAEGVFIPAQSRVLHLRKKIGSEGVKIFSYDLSYAEILDLAEGDYVLLRKNSDGFLIDEEIDDVDDGAFLDKITDWKNALSALLLTKDYAEIAHLMCSKGVTVTPTKIKSWEGGDGIAPHSEIEFRALIAVLGDEGKLNPNIENVKKYAADTWADIRKYIVSRQQAGNKARRNILEELLSRIKGLDIDSDDGAKNLDLQLGQNMLIRRVASIDHTVSYVSQSSPYKIEALKGNKWLR